MSADLLKRRREDVPGGAIEVQAGADVLVRVPFRSALRIYAGGSASVHDVRGDVTIYGGRDVRLRGVWSPVHVSAAGAIDLDCATLASENVELLAGRDLRFRVRDLQNATIVVDDLAGHREADIGEGRRRIHLRAGGDVVPETDG